MSGVGVVELGVGASVVSGEDAAELGAAGSMEAVSGCSMKTSVGSKPRTFASAWSWSMEGVYSCVSRLLSTERFMPLAAANRVWVIWSSLRRVTTVWDKRGRDNFFIGSPLWGGEFWVGFCCGEEMLFWATKRGWLMGGAIGYRIAYRWREVKRGGGVGEDDNWEAAGGFLEQA